MIKKLSCPFALLAMGLFFVSSSAGAQQIFVDGPRAVMHLNGEWDSRPAPDMSLSLPPADGEWESETVPHLATRHISGQGGPYAPNIGLMLNADGSLKQTDKLAAWFRRSFTPPAEQLQDHRAILRFGGIAFKSAIYINGEKVHDSVQALVPIEIDITEQLKPDVANEIVVAVAGRDALVDTRARTYIAPASGVRAGIWGDVHLHFLPRLRVDDVFVRTSVNRGEIELDLTVLNSAPQAATATPRVVIRDGSGLLLHVIEGAATEVAAGQQKVVALKSNWTAPQLWSPDTPTLYAAEVSIADAKGATVDRMQQRFGFREFEIRGHDFYLNGRKTTLRRTSSLTEVGIGDEAGSIRIRTRISEGNGVNAWRMHLGFHSLSLLDAADRMGMMMIPESSWYAVSSKYDLAHAKIWVPHVVEYQRRFIREHRNHPSIVMWSLTNETMWGNTDDARMKAAHAILEAAVDTDPTRPMQGDAEVTWAGKLPVINIHYPEYAIGRLNGEYPNASFVVPNDFYWLKKDADNKGWRADFKWDRPLVIGEYWWTTGDILERTSFMGESVFDWEKWRFQSFGGGDGNQDNGWFKTLQRFSDAYRVQGVAGLNPWSGRSPEVMPPLAVRPLDFHPNLFGGKTARRTFVVFNDTPETHDRLHLQCRLSIAGRTVWSSEISSPAAPGEHRIVEIPIDAPVVDRIEEAQFTVRLRHWRSGGAHALWEHQEPVYVLPVASLADVNTASDAIVLLDSSGETQAALKTIGLDLNARPSLASANLDQARLVIVGEKTPVTDELKALSAFADRGGAVVVLRQDKPGRSLPQFPEVDPNHAASQTYARIYDHPILEGLADAQLAFWRPDHVVVHRTLHKAAAGPARSILDAGGRYGLNWTPLAEVPHGEGLFILSQLHLVDRLDIEPVASHLLSRIIRYALNHKPSPRHPLRLLSDGNEALSQVLEMASIHVERGLGAPGQGGPVLFDASYKPSGDELKQLRAHVDAGGTLWLLGFGPSHTDVLSALLPFEPMFTKPDPTVQTAARRSSHPIVNNLSSMDWFWSAVDIGARDDYFGRGQPTAKLGENVLVLSSIHAGVVLTEPGLLVWVPVGKGGVLVDGFEWPNAFGAETDKVARIASSIAGTLGAGFTRVDEPSFDYFHVDIREHTNMGYYDAVPNDGKGGWTDEGENDMRFFLINHTGQERGQAGGVDVGAAEFPSVARFADRPFQLVDPTRNDGRGVIVLPDTRRLQNLPTEIKGIRVGERADRLWFLQCVSWASRTHGAEVARYIVHYVDGTQVVAPMRLKIDVGDWWNPRPAANARVGWTGANLLHSPIGLYVTQWENPSPEKVIDRIDLIGNPQNGILSLLGITGGRITGTTATGPANAVIDWDLSKVQDGVVPNLVAGAPVLKAVANPPVVEQISGEPAARFHAGDRLNSSTPRPLFAGRPAAVEVRFSLSDVPNAHMGGIFEAMSYRKSGFRFGVDRQQRILVEGFEGDGKSFGLRSRTVLELNRLYDVRVLFTQDRAALFVDGRLEDARDTPGPAPFSGPISIGVASGKDYLFAGHIQRVRVME